MRAFLSDFLSALTAARAVRKRTNHLKRRHQERLVQQAARLASMSNTDLFRCARQWGGNICVAELKRRRLVP